MFYNIYELTCVVCNNKLTLKTTNKQDYSKEICTDDSAYKLTRCPSCDTPMREILADSGLMILNSKPSNLGYINFNKLNHRQAMA